MIHHLSQGMQAVFVFVFCSIFFGIGLFSCGSAPKSDAVAVEISSPPGAVCYAIIQGGTAVGGNCVRVQ